MNKPLLPRILILVIVAISVASRVAECGPVSIGIKPTVTLKAEPFSLEDVRLLDSPFKRAMELNAAYLISLEPDRLLSGFRREAGLPPKAPGYGGWEAEGVAGHTLGHYLTALSQQYRATHDRRYLTRVNYIVDELALCQNQDTSGYVAAIPNGKQIFADLKRRGGGIEGWVPWYTMHKLFAGLRDAYLLCGNNRAKSVLIRLADWADSVTSDLTPQEMETMLGTEHGGMAEILADVYDITGNAKYLALAKRFCHRLVMDPLAHDEDRLDGLHANTQIPKITGAARIYELTGEDYYHSVAENFWNFTVMNRTYVIGGNSDSEHFFPPEQFDRHLSTATCETCNTYNMLKLTEHLFAWEPASNLMDYYERALYNQILGSQDPDTGMFTYFQSLKPGHFRLYSNPTNAFWCCVGTGMENHTKYGEMIYSHSADTLWVNLFIPSELKWTDQGVIVRQETKFPESEITRLTIKVKRPVQFMLKLRAPEWLAAPLVLRVNGQLTKSSMEAGYATLDRAWHNGDRVEAQLPMALRTEPLPHTPNTLAVLYGPVVLAAELGTEGMDRVNLYEGGHNENHYRNLPTPVAPVFVTQDGDVIKCIQPIAGERLAFKTKNLGQPEDVTLIPYWRMPHERYSVYFDTFTPAEWGRRQVELHAKAEAQKKFEARTVDDVQPGEQQSENDHMFKGKRSSTGGDDPKWRDAHEEGWFEYTLKALPDEPLELFCTYWGGDGGRRFDIMADGKVVATQTLNRDKPGEFFEMTYALPGELTKGKNQITVRFQACPGRLAGGLFGLRVMRAEPGKQ